MFMGEQVRHICSLYEEKEGPKTKGRASGPQSHAHFTPGGYSCELRFNNNKGEKQGCFSYCGTVFFRTGRFKSSYMSLDGIKTHQVLTSLPGESHSK